MIVKSLNTIDFDELLDCFLAAFKNYFVEMPTNRNYYKQRWITAKVDFKLSYGMFDEGKLVGFIINAIDKRNGYLVAYNTGTGVLPDYRGQKITKLIYEYALVELKKAGVKECSLEVITENKVAIKSYESIGFRITETLKCFKGKIGIEKAESIQVIEKSLDIINSEELPNQEFYSWDNHFSNIQKGDFKFYQVLNQSIPESYFILNPKNGYLAQFDLLNEQSGSGAWERLFLGIKQISKEIKINNVNNQLTNKIDALESIGLNNTVNQYKMKLPLASS